MEEIGRIRKAIDLPLEVFVHGALCVAYSGQCLTSEALGGRSANRGECAQACRMPYQIVCDGRLVDLDNIQYLLSPQDLAAYDLIPRLIELGVASLKIEGRLKTPEYVANITRHYRIGDRRCLGRTAGRVYAAATSRRCSSRSRAASPTASSTGTTTRCWSGAITPRSGGFFSASSNRITRSGRPAFRGGPGQARRWPGLRRRRVDRPRRARRSRLRGHQRWAKRNEHGRNDWDAAPPGRVELRFGREAIDLRELEVGQRVWKTDDPELTRRLRRSFEGPPSRKVDLDLEVIAIGRRAAADHGFWRKRPPRVRVAIERAARHRPKPRPPTSSSSRPSSAGWGDDLPAPPT